MHFKNTSITKYFCSTSPNNISLPTNSIPPKPLYKIAYGNVDKSNNTDVSIVIHTVPIQQPTLKQTNHKQKTHQEKSSQIPSPLLIPKFPTAITTLQKSSVHQLDRNIDITKTIVVSDYKQTIPKNRPFLRKRSSSTPLLKLKNPTSTTLQQNKKNSPSTLKNPHTPYQSKCNTAIKWKKNKQTKRASYNLYYPIIRSGQEQNAI